MNILRRIPPVVVWVVGLLAAVLGMLGVFSSWCAIAAGLLTLMVVTVQYKSQGSVAVIFTASDWKKEHDSFRFSVGRHHGKGLKPVVSVYMPMNGGGYEEIMCEVHTLESGEVILGAGAPFDGEVRIS